MGTPHDDETNQGAMMKNAFLGIENLGLKSVQDLVEVTHECVEPQETIEGIAGNKPKTEGGGAAGGGAAAPKAPAAKTGTAKKPATGKKPAAKKA